MIELDVPNVIWYNNKYLVSPSLLRTCSSRTTDMTNSCITHGTLGAHTSREYKSTRGLPWALFPKYFFIFSASHWAGCQLWLRPYMASTAGVVTIGQDSSLMLNWRFGIRIGVLCHKRRHILRSFTWTALDLCQLDRVFRTPSML